MFKRAYFLLCAIMTLYVQVAEKEAQRRSNPLRVKKLFLLAALLIEQYHQHMRSSQKVKTKKRRPEVKLYLGYVEVFSRLQCIVTADFTTRAN